MTGSNEAYSGPLYLSSHSADVILSDIRPIKLRPEALNSINVLLDEFLQSVLRTAQSLLTDKLRAGLLSLLPTTLGKEALLEAELELRAYWERTKGGRHLSDDKDSFDLKWAFELLRLKCQAYSTLNETDEDPADESRLEERMAHTHLHRPSPALIAPASLWLTAILESMCEHILSNVGRVASRDSSRTYANSQDLFVALCEDDAIYTLFKSMKVYALIEEMSKTPKARRSKSFSRNDKLSMSTSRTSSPQENSSRQSSDTPSGSRSSLDKARAMKKYISNPRLSSDTSLPSRSESVLSEETQATWAAYQQEPSYDDDASLQEFDDLMRSTSTMKVSLTPDRLRSMEVYKQEKDRRAPPLSSPDSTPPVPSRLNGTRSVPRHVDSITEDDENSHGSHSRSHSHTPSSRTPVAVPPASGNRSRSQSNVSPSHLLRKPSKSSVHSTPSPNIPPTPQVPMAQTRDRRGASQGLDTDPFPQKTRRRQVNRESLDLDTVMAGSDDELGTDPAPAQPTPSTPKRTIKVSSAARELKDFLDAGPPPTSRSGYNPPAPPSTTYASPPPITKKVSSQNRDLLTFLDEGPPDYMMSPPPATVENEKPKNGGRLQRMMSKLSMSTEKARQGSEDSPKSRRQPSQPILQNKSSNSSFTMPNYTLPRPVPPPQPISPPASPKQDETVTLDYSMSSARMRKPSANARNTPKWDYNPAETFAPSPSTPPAKSVSHQSSDAFSSTRSRLVVRNGVVDSDASKMTNVNGNGHGTFEKKPIAVAVEKPVEKTTVSKSTPALSTSNVAESKKREVVANVPRKVPPPIIAAPEIPAAVPEPEPEPTVPSSEQALAIMQDMQRLMSKANSAEECRIIVDMFLAKSGAPVQVKPVEMDVPYPSPSPSDTLHDISSEVALEQMLVEFLLGSEAAHDGPPLRKKKHSSKKFTGVKVVDINSVPPTPTPVAEAHNTPALLVEA